MNFPFFFTSETEKIQGNRFIFFFNSKPISTLITLSAFPLAYCHLPPVNSLPRYRRLRKSIRRLHASNRRCLFKLPPVFICLSHFSFIYAAGQQGSTPLTNTFSSGRKKIFSGRKRFISGRERIISGTNRFILAAIVFF